MTVAIGSYLGPYEILAPLGAGGMGEVYRARDAKLNRDVAIKVLPELFASDPERLARFTREAQVLAALNHPNIAHIYGVEGNALVMELVAGDDLSTLIARGPLPLHDALAVARQIADALEAAHEQGIVHRDLKPGNIKVRADGTVKVLDFGLAKAIDPAAASSVEAMHSPTLTMRGTQMGIVVGTAAYMAPEQARGKAVDRRADIWAFGVVVYEMLTGAAAFRGEDISEILATVLKTEPDWQALPAAVPSSVVRLLRRCLEKDPRKRLSAIGDARLELDELDAAPPSAGAAPSGPPRRSIGINLAVALLALAVIATAGTVRFLSPAAVKPGSVVAGSPHLGIVLPETGQVRDIGRAPIAISPDGQRIVYVGDRDGQTQLYVRALSDPQLKPIAGSDGARSPFFSPDGEWIGFFAQGKLKKVTVAGTAMQVVTDGAPDTRGGAWGPDGQIYFAPNNVSGLWKVPAAGGTAVPLTQLDRAHGEISHRWPCALPDGKTLLFTVWTGPGPDERRIVAQSLVNGERRVLVNGGDSPRYVSTGYLAYVRLDELFAIPWRSTDTQAPAAIPVALAEHPRVENEGAAAFDISTNGVLAFLSGGPHRYAQRIVWVDRAGRVEPLPLPDRDYESAWLSPNGRQALVQLREGSMGLWLYDFTRHTLTPLATTGGSSQAGLFTPDGKRVVYRATRLGKRNLYWRAADGTGDEEPLLSTDAFQTPNSFSPDGRFLVFNEQGNQAGPGRLMMLTIDNGHAGAVATVVGGGATDGQVSPDGRWLAYQIDDGEVYVQPFPGPGPRTQISTDGGKEVLWSRDGTELFYVNRNRLMAVDVSTAHGFSAGTPHVVFEGRYRASLNSKTAWDVSADGHRFLRIQQVTPDPPSDRIDVVLNWLAEIHESLIPNR